MTVTVGGAAEDTNVNFESIVGGSAGDTLTGNGLATALFGNGGTDGLDGGAGEDVLDGGSGKDFLTARTGRPLRLLHDAERQLELRHDHRLQRLGGHDRTRQHDLRGPRF